MVGHRSPVGWSGRWSLSAIVVTLLAAAMLLWPLAAAGQSPTPGFLGTVDARTTDGPTMVGGPVEVLIGVVLLGAGTAAATAVVVRLLQKRATHG
jgi:hypothetical protein